MSCQNSYSICKYFALRHKQWRSKDREALSVLAAASAQTQWGRLPAANPARAASLWDPVHFSLPPPPHLFQSLMEITLSKTFLHLLLLFRALHKKPPCWPLPWPAPCPSLRGCPLHSRKHEFIATHACLALLSLCCETLKPRLAFLTTIITFSWKGHSHVISKGTKEPILTGHQDLCLLNH